LFETGWKQKYRRAVDYQKPSLPKSLSVPARQWRPAGAPRRGWRVKLEDEMAYTLDKHATEGFVSPATQARFDRALATAQDITGTILAICRDVSNATEAFVGPMARQSRARRTAKVLRGLSDRQLADIGISRVEIGAVAHEAVEAQVNRRHM
jgi:uncharacterized protein YjiS (DUF1127 family)